MQLCRGQLLYICYFVTLWPLSWHLGDNQLKQVPPDSQIDIESHPFARSIGIPLTIFFNAIAPSPMERIGFTLRRLIIYRGMRNAKSRNADLVPIDSVTECILETKVGRSPSSSIHGWKFPMQGALILRVQSDNY
jgi:hypothetical protein